MPKITNVLGYSVTVFVDYNRWTKDIERRAVQQKSDAEEVMRNIRRHVDRVSDTRLDVEKEDVCEYCGANWTEDSPKFNGGCCDEDMENEP